VVLFLDSFQREVRNTQRIIYCDVRKADWLKLVALWLTSGCGCGLRITELELITDTDTDTSVNQTEIIQ
jgi:hypothetical protein